MSVVISACIVLYKNDAVILKKAIDSFLQTNLDVRLFLIDNSPTDELKNITSDSRIEYIHNPSNPGFGAGHNIAIQKVIHHSRYHLVLNPDIYFDEGIIEKVVKYMDSQPDIGVVMPQILYPDGKIQYLAKLLPSPLDFVLRRFIPISVIKSRIGNRFELRRSGYNQIMDVPFLSGCFLFFKIDVLEKVNGFDEKIFMYTEDIDICRRVINAGYRSVFYPDVCIYHDHHAKSFKSLETFRVYLRSAIYYFNKWGWLFDKQRKEINKKTLKQLK